MSRWLLVALSAGLIMTGTASADETGPAVYELRIYVCEPGKLEALHTRFREHTLRIFEKHGMQNVAYWNPTEGEGADNTLIYVLKHRDRASAMASWAAFRADPEWQQVAAASQQAHGKILARPPDSIFLSVTDYSPPFGPADPSKLYELRTYTAAEGKLDSLHARFRDHTDRIFNKHGMQAYAYWQPLDQPRSQNVMLYILEHESQGSARKAWQSFAADPEWQQVARDSERDGKLLAVRPESVFLKVSDFSPRP